MDSLFDYFQATQGVSVSVQAGRMTLQQIASLMDARTGIACCLSRSLQEHVPSAMNLAQLRIVREALLDFGSTIPSSQRMLKVWYRWTHPFTIPKQVESMEFAQACHNYIFSVFRS